MADQYSGVGGTVSADAQVFDVVDWEMTISNELANTTHAGTSGWKTSIPTVAGGEGSMNCIWDKTSPPDKATTGKINPKRANTTPVAMVLNIGGSGLTYSFNANIKSISVKSVTTDAVKFSASFASTGAVTGPA